MNFKIAKYRVGETVMFGDMVGTVVGCYFEEGQIYYDIEWDEDRPLVENVPESYLIDEPVEEVIKKINVMPIKEVKL
jgi:hypothetical protein